MMLVSRHSRKQMKKTAKLLASERSDITHHELSSAQVDSPETAKTFGIVAGLFSSLRIKIWIKNLSTALHKGNGVLQGAGMKRMRAFYQIGI